MKALSKKEVALEILRSKCVEVEQQAEADVLVGLLEAILKDCDIQYYSISAPEANVLKKVAIIRHPNLNINLINPKILSKTNRIVSYKESCPAFPNQKINCFRYNDIVLQNGFSGEKLTLSGLPAILVQHEVDHLNGRLFFDNSIRLALVREGGIIKAGDFCPCGSKQRFSLCCMKD